jgi:hypothetical protein
MNSVTLERVETGDQGTFGVLRFDGATLFTGELPDRGNASNLSCIPTGQYDCKWTYSPAFKRMMYVVTGVDHRSGIRIHPANLMGDTTKGFKSHLYGCIALGKKTGTLAGQRAVLASQPAVRLFEDAMDRQPFKLEII